MASPQNGKYRAQMLNESDEDDQSPGISKQDTEDSRWEEVTIEPKYHRFPYCIVWTPLPVISWFLPFIGHAGICTYDIIILNSDSSDGVIHDFAGSGHISVDDFAFGDPHKYVELEHKKIRSKEWDKCIQKTDDAFTEEDYNFFTNNCHSYVAAVLNTLRYNGKTNWNMVDVWALTVTKSKYIR